MKDFETLHNEINAGKGTAIVLLFYISLSQPGLRQWD